MKHICKCNKYAAITYIHFTFVCVSSDLDCLFWNFSLVAGPVVKVGELLPDCEICDFLKDFEMC